jgi:uncharacterized protein (TIRG00374 family)
VKRLRKWLPIVISLILVCVLAALAPWDEIGKVLQDLDLWAIIVLIGLSLLYYGLKAIRFWYILQAMGIRQPLNLVALSYIGAQPVSLLPAGEIYRSHALRRHTGVPVNKSIGQFTLQGLFEGGAMAAILFISALALGTLRVPALILCIIVLLLLLLVNAGYLKDAATALNRLPFVDITENTIEQFSQKNRAALSREWFPLLFGLSFAIEIVGTGIAYVSVAGIGGHISAFQAAFLYVIPIIIGFISLLPGGIGLSEQGAIGVLLLSKISFAVAVAATLIMRVTIVGLGVFYGLIAQVISYVLEKKEILADSTA